MSIDFSKYNKNQLILTSDRVIFNAKKDHLFLIGDKSVGISTNGTFHVNANEKVIVNAPKVYLGLASKGTIEPLVKGDTTESVINEILDHLYTFAGLLKSAKGVGSGVIDLTMINTAAQALQNQINNTKNKVKNIKSEVSYTI